MREVGACRSRGGDAASHGALHRRRPAGVRPRAREVEARRSRSRPGAQARRAGDGAERRARLPRRGEVEYVRTARRRQETLECGEVALAQRRERLADVCLCARKRDGDELATRDSRGFGAVEQPLKRRRGLGSGERLVEHAPVEVHVQVDDRARAEAGQGLGVDGAGRNDLGHGFVRHGHDHRVGVLRAFVEKELAPLDRAYGRAELDAHAGAVQRRGSRVSMQALQRHSGDADVARIGGVEQPRPEDHRRERKRSLGRGQVEGRERDEVPELGNRGVGLVVRVKPFAECLLVELLVRGIELAKRRRSPERIDAVAPAERREAHERGDEVERSGERRTAKERGRFVLA